MGKLLEIKNFHYYYGNIQVVKGIDLYVEEGEIVTLIGANGAGKTTTMQSISGLTPAPGVRGEILFNGRNIQKLSGFEITKRGLCQVLEGRHIFSQLTVLENLETGAYLRRDKKNIRQDINSMYKLFPRLEERKSQLGGTLSGGEQQMLAIARAMLGSPKMLLLDEPSLGLAPLIIKEIFEAIVAIREQGTTILFVEQNSKIALNTADRGYVMQTGEMILNDSCDNLLQNEEVRKAYMGAD
ncbi:MULTISPECIES: ABC transporter ATP-binding protein [unclassified Lacrimispora]|uniref:ABC transporter ATP-binding protein n=1 Tax=unclassified Lacrimispora TaxID=2719232 RepID=UPI003045266C|nr:ABC transporter ATP-binding protein [Lachnospiraceae bacterium]